MGWGNGPGRTLAVLVGLALLLSGCRAAESPSAQGTSQGGAANKPAHPRRSSAPSPDASEQVLPLG